MESEPQPSRSRRKLAVTLAALTVLAASACSHHHNNSAPSVNTGNNTMSENATTQVFGATFATDLSGSSNSTPANVAPGDITPVSNTTFPVAVNSMGAANTTGQN